MLKSPPIFIAYAKKAVISTTLICLGVFALASMGGGGNKSKDKLIRPEFTPIRTTNGFTLKAGPSYRGSVILRQEKTSNLVSYNSVVTYQRGNTTYILPCKYKMQTAVASPATGSSLQLFNLKIKIHK
ncbi:MAG: hypothetical protein ABIU63_13775 [Chitinophagaceae bacterium]